MTASSASPEPTSTSSLRRTGSTAAVIVTHRRAELLRASLEQVVAQTHPIDWIIRLFLPVGQHGKRLASEEARPKQGGVHRIAAGIAVNAPSDL